MTTELDNDTLEWAAEWIEGSLKGEANERVREFGRNMAMTLRAAKAMPRVSANVAPAVDEMGIDTNFPLSETLRLLVEWAQHLHVSHECDCDGWEQRSFLIEAAQRYRSEIAQSAPASTVAPQKQSDEDIRDRRCAACGAALVLTVDAATTWRQYACPNSGKGNQLGHDVIPIGYKQDSADDPEPPSLGQESVQCNVCGFCAVDHVGVMCQSPPNGPPCFGRMFVRPLVIDADWRCRPDSEEQEVFIDRCIADAIHSVEVRAPTSPADIREMPLSAKTGIDSIARHIARPIRGCATDDQYTDVVQRATDALTAAAETLARKNTESSTRAKAAAQTIYHEMF